MYMYVEREGEAEVGTCQVVSQPDVLARGCLGPVENIKGERRCIHRCPFNTSFYIPK